jgi:malic enzyme
MADEKLIQGPLPILLNLGDFGRPEAMIGHAYIYQMDGGGKRIEIILDKETSKALINFTHIFELKGIGFAGIKRRSEDGR